VSVGIEIDAGLGGGHDEFLGPGHRLEPDDPA
jgi:hypothetical protein